GPRLMHPAASGVSAARRRALPAGRATRPGASESEAGVADDPPDEPEPEGSGEDEADEREQVEAHDVGPGLRENADHRGAEQASEHDERDRDPVRGLVEMLVDVVEARAADRHLEA